MTTAHRRNNNATYSNDSVGNFRNRNSSIQHTRFTGPRIPSVPRAKDAVPRAGFDADDRGLSVAIASLGLSPGSNHASTTSGGSSGGSIALTGNSRFERTNNVPPRHRGGGEKEYAQSGLQSPREEYRDACFEQQQPPRRQNQHYSINYHDSSNHRLHLNNGLCSQSVSSSPSRPYEQIQPQYTANSREGTTQASPLHPIKEFPPMLWGPAYNSGYPAATVHHVQLQLQEWYKQQQQLEEFTHARPLISAQASQQFTAHFTPQQTRSGTTSPSRSLIIRSRPPSGSAKTRFSPPQTDRLLSNPTSTTHSLASYPPPLAQLTTCANQDTQSLHMHDQVTPLHSLQTRLSELPPLSSLWSDAAANQTLAYLHQTLLNEYDLPARDLTAMHYQRLYDGYFEELERDVQRGEDRMWVMGMALEEGERTAARERAERTIARAAEKMEHDAGRDIESRSPGTAARMDCLHGPVGPTITLEVRKGIPIDVET